MAECEWDPDKEEAALTTTPSHAEATVSVGKNGDWHLCASCAARPFFKKFKVRRALRRPATAGPGTSSRAPGKR